MTLEERRELMLLEKTPQELRIYVAENRASGQEPSAKALALLEKYELEDYVHDPNRLAATAAVAATAAPVILMVVGGLALGGLAGYGLWGGYKKWVKYEKP
jgi:hypothetical protein